MARKKYCRLSSDFSGHSCAHACVHTHTIKKNHCNFKIVKIKPLNDASLFSILETETTMLLIVTHNALAVILMS